MKHPFRPTPLVAGLLYVTLATLFALESTNRAELDLRWIPAILLIGLGIAISLGGLTRRGAPSPPTDHSRDEREVPLS